MKIVYSAIVAAAMMAATNPVLAGDAAAGEAAYNGKGCSGCHGAGGRSQVPSNPALNGKSADYIKKALSDYKSGAKQNATMNAMAAMLSDADVDNVAAYLGAQK